MPGWSDEEESSLDMLAAQTWGRPWLPVSWLSTLGQASELAEAAFLHL